MCVARISPPTPKTPRGSAFWRGRFLLRRAFSAGKFCRRLTLPRGPAKIRTDTEHLFQLGVFILDLFDKLRILSDAAKYDAACTSSGVDRDGKGGQLGNPAASGICHS